MQPKTAGKYFRIQTLIKEWLDAQGLSAAKIIRNFVDKTTVELENLKNELELSDWKGIIYDFFPDYIERNRLSRIQIRMYAELEACICLMTERISDTEKEFDKADVNDAVQIILCLEYSKQNPKPCQNLPELPKNPSLRYGNKKKSCVRQEISPYPQSPILHVMGEKSWFIEEFIKILNQCPGRTTECIDIFGGSGYLTQLAYISKKFKKIIYNDDDMDKQNFFDIITKSATSFKVKCLCSALPKINGILTDDEKKMNSAVELFLASRNQGLAIIKQLDDLPLTSKVFQNVKRTSQDGVAMAQKYRTKTEAFLVVDPPYSNTKGYENRGTNSPQKEFLPKDHRNLAKALLNSQGIFLYFCRATVKRSHVDPFKPLPQDVRQRGESEDLFANHNLYVRDFLYRNNGIIERVISNYPFDGFSKFEFHNIGDNCLFF